MADKLQHTFGTLLQRKFVTIKDEEGNEVKKFQPRFRITETALDLYSEVVVSKGVDMKIWKANPQVFFGHRSFAPPIGAGVVDTIEQTDDFIEVDKIFDDDGSDEFATLISGKIQKGFLTRSSIGFRSNERSDEPMFKGQQGVNHLKSTLFESSIVPLPALPSAGVVKEDIKNIRHEFDEFRGMCKDAGHEFIDEDVEFFVSNYPILDDDQREALGFAKKVSVPGFEFEEKAGAVISKKNKKILGEASVSLRAAAEALDTLLKIGEVEDTVEEIEDDDKAGHETPKKKPKKQNILNAKEILDKLDLIKIKQSLENIKKVVV